MKIGRWMIEFGWWEVRTDYCYLFSWHFGFYLVIGIICVMALSQCHSVLFQNWVISDSEELEFATSSSSVSVDLKIYLRFNMWRPLCQVAWLEGQQLGTVFFWIFFFWPIHKCSKSSIHISCTVHTVLLNFFCINYHFKSDFIMPFNSLSSSWIYRI